MTAPAFTAHYDAVAEPLAPLATAIHKAIAETPICLGVDPTVDLTAAATIAVAVHLGKELRNDPFRAALKTIYADMAALARDGDESASEWLGELWTRLPLTVRAAVGDQNAADELADKEAP